MVIYGQKKKDWHHLVNDSCCCWKRSFDRVQRLIFQGQRTVARDLGSLQLQRRQMRTQGGEGVAVSRWSEKIFGNKDVLGTANIHCIYKLRVCSFFAWQQRLKYFSCCCMFWKTQGKFQRAEDSYASYAGTFCNTCWILVLLLFCM